MSGIVIFNAYPALYVELQSDFDHPLLDLSVSGRAHDAISCPFAASLTSGLELSTAERAVRAAASIPETLRGTQTYR